MFTLKIALGNEAMQTPEDVAAALRKVAEELEWGIGAGYARDNNGNQVGEWEFKPTADDEE